METLLTKLVIYATLGVLALAAIKIGNFYLLHRLVKEKAYQNYNKMKHEELQKRKLKQQIELEDILLRKEIEPYYLKAKNLFHDAIQAGNLNHEQILYFKKVIDDSLGDYLLDYKYRHYKNDAHEIYSKIKCSHISIDSFKKIIQLIKSFEAQNEGTYITIANEKEKIK